MDKKPYNNSYSVDLWQVMRTHKHDGLTSPILNFPIISAAPTDLATEGTVRIYSSGGTYRIYVFVAGGWHYTALT